MGLVKLLNDLRKAWQSGKITKQEYDQKKKEAEASHRANKGKTK